MSDDERRSEDVAGLFRKFGGDAKAYREFAPEPQMNEPAPGWRLVSGTRSGGAPTSPAAASSPAPAVVPVQAASPGPAPTPAPVRSLFSRPPVAPLRPAAPPPEAAALASPVQPSARPAGLAGLAAAPKVNNPEPPTAAPAAAPATRELDTLFSRLNGEPPPPAPDVGGAGLLSRWRRPS